MAAVSVANIVKTSLGPVGLDKMLVDDVGVRSVSSFPGKRAHLVHFSPHSYPGRNSDQRWRYYSKASRGGTSGC